MKTTTTQKSIFTFIIALLSVVSVNAGSTIIPTPVDNVIYQAIHVRTTDRSVILDWNTVSEENGGHFEVERSTNQFDFKTVALVLDGFNNEGNGKRYAFKEDISVLVNNQVAYYRLKQVDGNGKISYSTVVKVQQQK